jgi:hypothetical protein
LVAAVDNGVVEELKNSTAGSDNTMRVSRLAKQLEDDAGIKPDLARWAVESFAGLFEIKFTQAGTDGPPSGDIGTVPPKVPPVSGGISVENCLRRSWKLLATAPTMVIGGMAIFVSISVLFYLFPFNTVPAGGSSPQVTPSNHYPNTVGYWNQWAALRKQHDDAVNPLKENEIVEHTLKCAEWDEWIATQTISISQAAVDPELITLAVDFTSYYRRRVERWRYQAALMKAATDLRARGDSGWTLVEAVVRGALGDPFGVTTEMLTAENQLQGEAEKFLSAVRDGNKQFDDLRTRRDHIRAKIIATYGKDVSQ